MFLPTSTLHPLPPHSTCYTGCLEHKLLFPGTVSMGKGWRAFSWGPGRRNKLEPEPTWREGGRWASVHHRDNSVTAL